MVYVTPVIFTHHKHVTGISTGIISALYRDYICSVVNALFGTQSIVAGCSTSDIHKLGAWGNPRNTQFIHEHVIYYVFMNGHR